MIQVYYCLFSSICVRSPNQVLRLKSKPVEAPGEKVRQLLEVTWIPWFTVPVDIFKAIDAASSNLRFYFYCHITEAPERTFVITVYSSKDPTKLKINNSRSLI